MLRFDFVSCTAIRFGADLNIASSPLTGAIQYIAWLSKSPVQAPLTWSW
jgi:hypothetical protein